MNETTAAGGDNFSRDATRILGALYPALAARFGAECWEDDRFMYSLIHAVTGAAAGYYTDAHRCQDEYFTLANEAMFENLAIFLWLRRGTPLLETEREIRDIVQTFQRGQILNPLQQRTEIVAQILGGLSAFFDKDVKRAVQVIVDAVAQVYPSAFAPLQAGHSAPPAAFGIDVELASKLIHRVWAGLFAGAHPPEQRLAAHAAMGIAVAVVAGSLAATAPAGAKVDDEAAYRILGLATAAAAAKITRRDPGAMPQLKDLLAATQLGEFKVMLSSVRVSSKEVRQLGSLLGNILTLDQAEPKITLILAMSTAMSRGYWQSEQQTRKAAH